MSTRLFDCFTFFSEWEINLLLFRLNLLYNVVDFFVIVEGSHTHSGNEKEFIFGDHKEKFLPYMSKIIYIPIQFDLTNLVFVKANSYDPKNAANKLESQQRNAFSLINEKINDTDLVMVSDLDELVNPNLLNQKDELYKNLISIKRLTFEMDYNMYYMNNKCISGPNKTWRGAVITTGKQFKKTKPQKIRESRTKNLFIEKSGWHCSFLGGFKQIKEKILSYSHTEYNKWEFIDEKHILECVQEGKDIFNREDYKYELQSIANYPFNFNYLMTQFPNFYKSKHE